MLIGQIASNRWSGLKETITQPSDQRIVEDQVYRQMDPHWIRSASEATLPALAAAQGVQWGELMEGVRGREAGRGGRKLGDVEGVQDEEKEQKEVKE